MVDFSCILQEDDVILKRLSHKDDSAVLHVQHTDGSDVVLRIYPQEVPAYRTLADQDCECLPRIFTMYEREGFFVVEEEYIDGVSLQEMVSGGARMDEQRTIRITRKICEALRCLHDAGFIHRDVKPEHVLVTPEQRIVLIDLDAAMKILPEKNCDTQLLGTAIYAAPEQFGLSRSNERTDIYALGILMNELLTGVHPAVIRYRSGRLAEIIDRCTRMNPADRYQTIGELQNALNEAERKPVSRRNYAAAIMVCVLTLAVALGMYVLPGEPAGNQQNAGNQESGKQDTASAHVEGTDYLQLYKGSDTIYYNFRKGSQAAGLFTADGTAVDQSFEVYADPEVGFITEWSETYNAWRFDSEGCEMGASGYLHAEKDGLHYAIEVLVMGEPMSAYTSLPELDALAEGYLKPYKLEPRRDAADHIDISYHQEEPVVIYLAAMDGFYDLKPVRDSSLVSIQPYQGETDWQWPLFQMTFQNPQGGDVSFEVASNHNNLTFHFQEAE